MKKYTVTEIKTILRDTVQNSYLKLTAPDYIGMATQANLVYFKIISKLKTDDFVSMAKRTKKTGKNDVLHAVNRRNAKKIITKIFKHTIDKYVKTILKNHGTLYVSGGNSKTGVVPDVSLIPIRMCLNFKDCASICYARDLERLRPDLRARWAINSWLLLHNPVSFEKQLVKWLKKNRPSLFRFHVGGDFISQEYVDMAIRIAKKFNRVTFLAFTKSINLDFKQAPINLVVVKSAMENTPDETKQHLLNTGFTALAGKTIPKGLTNYTICPAQTTVKTKITCGECTICWDLPQLKRVKTIFFYEHRENTKLRKAKQEKLNAHKELIQIA
jgi:hypothetical protein